SKLRQYNLEWLPHVVLEVFLKGSMHWHNLKNEFIELINSSFIALIFSLTEVVIRKHATGVYISKRLVSTGGMKNPAFGFYDHHLDQFNEFYPEGSELRESYFSNLKEEISLQFEERYPSGFFRETVPLSDEQKADMDAFLADLEAQREKRRDIVKKRQRREVRASGEGSQTPQVDNISG
ncbi:hypothetical protein BJ508DRAFT_316440, partial [Ascobolus immersus RN42]